MLSTIWHQVLAKLLNAIYWMLVIVAAEIVFAYLDGWWALRNLP